MIVCSRYQCFLMRQAEVDVWRDLYSTSESRDLDTYDFRNTL